jgi:two-component system KDP operon response regulator KdpE
VSEAGALVLVVDDEPAILRILKSTLRAAGYRVETAETGSEAVRVVARLSPDLILLDLGLPDLDGKDVIESLRAWTHVPLVVLSARHDEAERIAALDLGADDYVTKPFHMGELQARIRTALRRAARGEEARRSYAARDLQIDFERRQVKVRGRDVRLTRKEFDLLACLARQGGQIVTHKQLLAAGWGPGVTDTQFARVYIGQIRQKLEGDPSAPGFILTESGIGYRLVAED